MVLSHTAEATATPASSGTSAGRVLNAESDETDTDDHRQRPAGIWRELFAAPELALFPASALAAAISSPRASAPRPVLVLPGFIGSDQSTLPLRSFLWTLGHRPYGWGLGRNVGPAKHIAAGVDRLLVDLFDRHQTPIDIVGWSLGGVFGRLMAFNRPEMIRQVISLGSPIKLNRDESSVNRLFELMGSIWNFSSTSRRLDIDKIPVPSTTVWTRTDGVVPGLACRQTPGPLAEVVEVRGAHCGLGHNGAVLHLVADRIALPEEEWWPFEVSSGMRSIFPSNEGG